MQLKTFKGGIHPPERKELTENKPIEAASLPSEIKIPLHQHTGAPCDPLVERGDQVKAGQKIAESNAFISAPIHSSVSGKVKGIEPVLSFLGTPVLSVIITPDEEQEQVNFAPLPKDQRSKPDSVRGYVREAGLVGLGGAAFPTHVKLSPPKEKPIDSVIINGCECEPYLTCDYRQMMEEPDSLIQGLEIILKTVGAKTGYIGIEDNKPVAINLITEKTQEKPDIKVVSLKTKYPQGSEKHLIKAFLNREVPSGGLPMDVAVVVQNVGTTLSVNKAIQEGKPLIERVLTVTGSCIKNPKNLRVKIGTSFKHLIDQCGGFCSEPAKVIAGGPMTGFAQFNVDVPVVKGTSGIIALARHEIRYERPHLNPCIRCGRCVNTCPAGLMPNEIANHSKIELWDQVEAFNVLDCIECGCCSFVCPARIPHVQFIRLAKAKIIAKQKEAKS